ncbi:TerD family protein [Croceicoccus mobilis]|uniref:Tellurium resistance protein TerZ n=1 Tax=Croceicoccus mobilis TaxID=1703339 RepID=A0A916YQC8_9SPHN|nr:TerD family protein [Croceicoccus mobilis]GGD56168.1 tellurium resistance protein TerZ [Croceicoccus mobilis]
MTISLKKNEAVSLSKSAPNGLTSITLGVGWDAAKPKGFLGAVFGGGGDIDLDASALMFTSGRQVVDSVWFGALTSKDGSVRHSGDNLTGDGDGDDESIAIDLMRLPPNIETIVLTVNSFRGQTFDKVENAFGRVVDNRTGRELARFDISDSGPHTGIILASLTRAGGDWTFKALGERAGGRTVHDLVSPSAALI